MADYYPLLSRALEALPDRSPALRKAVYDRARSALIGQLRSLEPPIPEADIDLEARALDAAIERLEADYGVKPRTEAPKPQETLRPQEPSKPQATPRPQEPPKPKEAPKPKSPETKAPEPPPLASPPLAASPPALPEPEPPPSPAVIAAPEPPAVPKASPPKPADAPPATEGGTETPAVSFAPPVRKPKVAEPANDPAAAEAAPASAVEAEAPPQPGSAASEAVNGRQRPKIDVVAPRGGRSRMLRNAVVGGLLLLVLGAIAVAAFMLRDQPAEIAETAEDGQETPVETPDSKFADRVGGEAASPDAARPPPDGASAPSAAAPEVMVAQRAILYEENAADPKAQPSSSTGRVTWRLEPINGEQGEPLQNAVRANVEFPDAGLTLAMTIKKNLDSTLPASHTVELAFTNYGKGEKRGVQDIGLLQLKDEANARGSPVSGLPVRVRDNLFLIGLSNLPGDIERNTDMLLRKNWLDLAVKYKSGQRAVLAFDKGNAGTQVMQNAFDQWRN